ncbi:MAG: MOSC domain-containing protein [Hyphomicrobiaceae bacterium]|nr:MOSC domain-containing protein [Hyphomicrobiaceae bacterium]
MSEARVERLLRYPVKGLSAQPLERVELAAGETIPFDRAWAIENGPGRFDPEHPKHLPKIVFVMLMRDEKLAQLEARFEESSRTLTLLRNGRQVAKGALETAIGRRMIEQFLAAYLQGSLRGAPKIVAAPGHSFSDVAAKCLHIVNLASLRDVEKAAGRALDPLRFRPNIIIDGLPAWQEFQWLDRVVRIGDVAFEIFARTQRCAATNVDPATGERDMAVPALIERTWGHTDFGVYGRVVAGGALAVGDRLVASA